MKIRYSETEIARLDALRRAAGARNRASYIRRTSLDTSPGSAELGELVGRIGLYLNEHEASPRTWDLIVRDLDALVDALRQSRTG